MGQIPFPYANFFTSLLRTVRYHSPYSFFLNFFRDRVSLYSPGCCRQSWPRTQKSACLCLSSAGIKGECHHARLTCHILPRLLILSGSPSWTCSPNPSTHGTFFLLLLPSPSWSLPKTPRLGTEVPSTFLLASCRH